MSVANKDLRRRIVQMITQAGEGHIPSAFSIVDIIAKLYGSVLRPEDYFILSKGHGCAALYVVLEKHGILTAEEIESYGTFGGVLGGHPDRTKVPGVLCSTGSLGHGLPMAVGLALGLKIQGKYGRVFVLMGDGECQEGTTWEAALVAKHHELNLVVIVDNNLSGAQLLPKVNLLKQFQGFGWNALEIDGHNPKHVAYMDYEEAPVAFIANTVKGCGVDFIEGHGKWHHKIPNQQEYDAIMAELA